MVKYWPDKGKSGFLVWRYLLKRDDDEPAPWTRDGKERIKKLGLTMQVKMIREIIPKAKLYQKQHLYDVISHNPFCICYIKTKFLTE